MIFHFILNPKSGRNRNKRSNMEQAIKLACTKRQLSYHIYYTTCPGDATEYVRSMVRISQDRQRFICVGGDGTINEIVNSAPCNPNVEFGVIPHGSGNDFVRNFTNTHLFHDIDAQIDGDTVSLDLIKCNESYCVNMVNIGFDCAVAKKASELKKYKIIPPSISYIVALVITVFKKFGTPMKLYFDDGEVIDRKLTLTAIGNGKFCGGGFKSAPNARLKNGMIEVVAIEKVSKLTFFKLVSSYKAGTYMSHPLAQRVINYRQVPHFRMEFNSPLPICVDGEIKGAKNIDFSVVHDGFRFVVPKGCQLLDDVNDNADKEAQ